MNGCTYNCDTTNWFCWGGRGGDGRSCSTRLSFEHISFFPLGMAFVFYHYDGGCFVQGHLAIPRGGIGHPHPNTPTPVHLRQPQYIGPGPTVGSHHAPGRMLPPWPQRSPPTTPPTSLVRILCTTPPVTFFILLSRCFRPSLLLYSNSKMFCV